MRCGSICLQVEELKVLCPDSNPSSLELIVPEGCGGLLLVNSCPIIILGFLVSGFMVLFPPGVGLLVDILNTTDWLFLETVSSSPCTDVVLLPPCAEAVPFPPCAEAVPFPSCAEAVPFPSCAEAVPFPSCTEVVLLHTSDCLSGLGSPAGTVPCWFPILVNNLGQ